MCTTEAPWINEKGPDGGVPDTDETRATFLHILKARLSGAKLNEAGQPPNIYLIFGFASQGYGDMENGWPLVESTLEAWCRENDERHAEAGTGWILMTQGDGDYGKKSIESIAQYVRTRGDQGKPQVPVVFIQSDFGYAAPGTDYWPTYASAGYFGPGLCHDKPKLDKEGKPRVNKAGVPMKAEAWGGYVKDANDTPTGQLGFPDSAIVEQDFDGEELRNHLGGIFVAGGGAITAEQVALYQMRQAGRAGDIYVPALALDGSASVLNASLASGYEDEAKEAVQSSRGKVKLTLEALAGCPVLTQELNGLDRSVTNPQNES